MKFTEKTRQIIFERAKNRCEKCGGFVGQGGQIHHRKARGMGGTKNPESRSLSNALYVHPSCHAWIESHREQAYENGWLVHNWQEPTQIPVRRGHDWVMLQDDGTVVLGE